MNGKTHIVGPYKVCTFVATSLFSRLFVGRGADAGMGERVVVCWEKIPHYVLDKSKKNCSSRTDILPDRMEANDRRQQAEDGRTVT